MHVALVILHADPARGGAERYTRDVIGDLAGHGVQCVTFAASFAEGWPGKRRMLKHDGFTRTRRRRAFLADWRDTQHGCDLVHAMLPIRGCDFYHPHAGIAADAGGRLLNPRRTLLADTEAAMLREDQPTVLALSELQASILRRHYPDLAAPVTPLFNGVDLDRWTPITPDERAAARRELELDVDERVAVIAGHNPRRKGIPQAIAAVERLNATGTPCRLLVASAAYQPVTDGSVTYLGNLADTRIAYRAADVFVLPSTYDQCSLSLLEAMAMGLPSVSTRQNGASEIVPPDAGVVLDDPHDVPAIADALSRCFADGTSMSAATLAVRGSLAQERHVRELVAAYRARLWGSA